MQKFSFIVQCDLAQLAQQGSLASFINEMKDRLEHNNYYFPLTTHMQILVTNQNVYLKDIDQTLREMERDGALLSPVSSKASELRDEDEVCSQGMSGPA